MDVASDAFEARLQQAALAFDAMPPKPPKPSSRRKQAVVALFDEITRLKNQGYEFDEISQLLVEQTGVEMSTGTLRKYWGAERRQRQGKKPQRRRSGKSQRSKKSSLPTQGLEEPFKVDEVAEADPKTMESAPEPAVSLNPVTPADDSGDTWPPVEDRGSNSPSESDPEPPTKQPEPKSNDDYWNDGGWPDSTAV